MPIDPSVFSVPPCETKAIPIEKQGTTFSFVTGQVYFPKNCS